MTKISVVLPVYNGELYLEESIKSVLNQTHKDFELIIVDDCSTDKTPVIAQKYAKKFKNVIYIRNEQNLKLPRALNKGFSIASGNYWTWTSCDNLYTPDALKVLATELESDSSVGLVYAGMDIIDELGSKLEYMAAGLAADLILKNVVGACFLYRKDTAKKIGEYNEAMFLCEDYEYWIRFSLVSRLKPINKCLYQYRRHDQSLSRNRAQEIIAKSIQVQKFYYKNFIHTRKKAALFYAHLRARDIYNPLRHFYLLVVLFYSPAVFVDEIFNILKRRC